MNEKAVIPEDLQDTYEMVSSGTVHIGGKYAMQIIERVAALQAEVDALKAEVARLSELNTGRNHLLIQTLEKECTELREDGYRLEWLASNEANLMTHRERSSEDEYFIWWQVVKGRKSISGHPLGSPRAAIDSARATPPQDVENGGKQ